MSKSQAKKINEQKSTPKPPMKPEKKGMSMVSKSKIDAYAKAKKKK